jgi:hypothetical protein
MFDLVTRGVDLEGEFHTTIDLYPYPAVELAGFDTPTTFACCSDEAVQ